MIVGELLEGVAGESVDPRVAHVEDVRGGGFDDHCAQGADVALVLVVTVLASPRFPNAP